jgi:hypothetical protein
VVKGLCWRAAGLCAVLTLGCCHDSDAPAAKAGAAGAIAAAPSSRLAFDQTSVDLGDILPESKSYASFTFTNTGSSTLHILSVVVTCGCTAYTMAKREYIPREHGTIKVEYQALESGGAIDTTLYILSDDSINPRQQITLKANVILPVVAEPRTMDLSLDAANAAAPTIVIHSTDNRAFSIREVTSTDDAISVPIDRDAVSTRFVLEPIVDVERLRTSLSGTLRFTISRQDVTTVRITYAAAAEFEAQPASIVIRKATPLQVEEWVLFVRSTCSRAFQIASISSQNGSIRALSQEQRDGGYRVRLAITPPRRDTELTFFDLVLIRMRNGSTLNVPCTGFYKR